MTTNNKGRTPSEDATRKTADHADSVAKRSKQRELLPVKPLSKYRAKQLRAIEPGTLGAALESRVAS